jgi:hypothetical protein
MPDARGVLAVALLAEVPATGLDPEDATVLATRSVGCESNTPVLHRQSTPHHAVCPVL